MYSEENEQLAEAAYGLWCAAHPDFPAWEVLPNKHAWRDLVNTYQHHPRVLLEPNEQEQCVIDALAGKRVVIEPQAIEAPAPEPVIEPVAEPQPKPKPAKPARKK